MKPFLKNSIKSYVDGRVVSISGLKRLFLHDREQGGVLGLNFKRYVFNQKIEFFQSDYPTKRDFAGKFFIQNQTFSTSNFGNNHLSSFIHCQFFGVIQL